LPNGFTPRQGVEARHVPLRLNSVQKGYVLDGGVLVSHRVFDQTRTLVVGQGTQ